LVSGAFTLGASWLLINAGRRDRHQDEAESEFQDLQDQVRENTEDIAHIGGYLQGKSDYKPRER
jgi:hypothetical protein